MHWLKTFIKILLTGSVVLVCGACSLLGLAMFSPLIAEGMAAKMLPPQYPGSKLVEARQGGGSAAGSYSFLYQTGDNVDQVEAFYERHLPAAGSTYDIAELWHSAHQRCDFSLPAQLISRLEQGRFDRNPYLPCVGVDIYPDLANPYQTLIILWMHWPSS
jgi:hypothetical protein